jgi:hypothetical protein
MGAHAQKVPQVKVVPTMGHAGHVKYEYHYNVYIVS